VIPQKPHYDFANHQLEMAQIAYDYLLSRSNGSPWIHVGPEESGLARFAERSAKRQGVKWVAEDAELVTGIGSTNVFVDGDALSEGEFAAALRRLDSLETDTMVCGTGYHTRPAHRVLLNKKFSDRITHVASSVWWVRPGLPPLPKNTKGAVFIPCFQDTWRIEENLAWRPELVNGLDVHIFDHNFAPAEMDRLSAVARNCDWTYHHRGTRDHPDFTSCRAEFADYNRFIWQNMTGLSDGYDFVIKLDTDACILDRYWWHEAAARLHGRTAMMGTFDLRPMYEVAYFWHVAWQNGYNPSVPAYPMHLQGGIYAVSRGALRSLGDMGFLPGPHHDFTEDGYMSYCAQMLGVEMIPSTTLGSWTRLKRPPLEHLGPFKAIHPLMRRDLRDMVGR